MVAHAGAVLQLLLDQGVFAPLFLATFISVLFIIDVRSSEAALQPRTVLALFRFVSMLAAELGFGLLGCGTSRQTVVRYGANLGTCPCPVLQGKPHMIKPKLQQDWFETIKVNWVLWIPAQYFNFRFVPPNLQVCF